MPKKEMRAADHFRGRLLEAIREAGYSQRVAAGKLGVSESVLSKWINGPNEPSLNHLAEIRRVTGASTDWLLGLTNAREPEAGLITPAPVGLTPRARKELEQMAEQLEREATLMRKKLKQER